MLKSWNRPSVRITSALVLAAATVGLTEAAGPFRNPLRERTSVEQLAEKIDKVEKHIDKYGSVVAKTPDVWGEARLTKYRRNVETVLFKELEEFAPTVSAAISRSDQAFLASSLAMQAALGGQQAALVSPSGSTQFTTIETTVKPDGTKTVKETDPKVVPGETTTAQPIPAAPAGAITSTINARTSFLDPTKHLAGFGEGGAVALEPTVRLDQLQRYLDHLNQLRRNNDGDDMSDSPGYAMHLVRIPVSVLPGSLTKEGYGAEINVIAKPHLHEKLLQETFRGLVMNDIIDQLALPMAKLIDLPNAEAVIAALKSKQQLDSKRAAFEEEKKELQSDLDDIRRRIKDANDGLVPLLAQMRVTDEKIAEQKKRADQATLKIEALKTDQLMSAKSIGKSVPLGARADFNMKLKAAVRDNSPIADVVDASNPDIAAADEIPEFNLLSNRLREEQAVINDTSDKIQEIAVSRSKITKQIQKIQKELDAFLNESPKPTEPKNAQPAPDLALAPKSSAQVAAKKETLTPQQKLDREKELVAKIAQVESQVAQLDAAIKTVSIVSAVATAPSRRAQLPFSPEQLVCVYSHEWLGDIASLILKLKSDDHNKRAALLVDVHRVLADNLHNAHGALVHRPELWQHCTHELALAIRQNDCPTVERLRNQFFNCVPLEWREASKDRNPIIAFSWAIIVESALLNERLIEDMKLMQTAKNCFCLSTDWMDFYNPEPGPEVVAAFNQYVECRWPIHVFAIDPMTDDQNVVDAFSQRREMQLALSLAFASGKINAQKFMRYARTLDLDMQSIALNRTAVGFSHGDDTFGWRFYPRVQSPPSRGNLTVATRELLVGGFTQDQQLATRRLEPGMRECTAIVLLPAFVPYAIFDFRTNWFKLTNPKKREFDLEDGVEISADIQSLRQLSQACVKDAHKYRQSEVYMLTRTVDQLERRLPLQTTYVQIPFENSLGGFEFFNGGAPDLAPELHGFYGEPGISAKSGESSSIFLVGENFSVHETEVVIGNKLLTKDQVKLLSRQVMEVTVAAPVGALGDKVEIHVATPYGVSNHLEVPLIAAADEAAAKALAEHEDKRHVDRFAWKDVPTPTVVVTLKADGNIDKLDLAGPDKATKLQIVSKATPSSALMKVFGPTPTELAAWVVISSADPTKEARKTAIGKWPVPANGEIDLNTLINTGDTALIDAFKSALPYGFLPAEVEFIGFVRGATLAAPTTQPLPTLRLENSFKIKVALVVAP